MKQIAKTVLFLHSDQANLAKDTSATSWHFRQIRFKKTRMWQIKWSIHRCWKIPEMGGRGNDVWEETFRLHYCKKWRRKFEKVPSGTFGISVWNCCGRHRFCRSYGRGGKKVYGTGLWLRMVWWFCSCQELCNPKGVKWPGAGFRQRWIHRADVGKGTECVSLPDSKESGESWTY